MREWFIPCPLCGRYQALLWRRVEWPEDRPGEAHYRCCGCEELIPHHKKASMEARGEWRAQNPGPNRVAGFHLSELHSPFRSWGELAEDWLKAQGNPEKLRAFFNTSLAECWNDEGQGTIGESELLKRRETYAGIPEQAAELVAGVDMQDDRAEVSVYGYGRGEESWLIAHRVIPGDPSTPALWNALDAYLLTTWQHPVIGPVQIHAAAIDSGGHYTNAVCGFAEARRGRRVWAIKGATGARPIWPRKQSKAPKGRVFVIGVDSARSLIAQRLKIADPGPGRMHFPTTVDEKFFSQMTSEFQQTTYRRGRPERAWVRRPGRAAETWDCANYAYSALCGLRSHGIDLDSEVERIEVMKGAARPAEQGPGYRVYRSKFVSGA